MNNLPYFLKLSAIVISLSFVVSAAQSSPNFIIIFADDLGYGDLSSYGHPTFKTPHLDEMARDGVRLTSFYASPACSPSRAQLLTGRYPLRTGVPGVLGPDEPGGIAQDEILLSEALKPKGYRTACIGKWHLGSRSPHLPTENGFDEFFGLLYSNDMRPPWVQTERPLQLWRNTEAIEHPVDQNSLTRRYTEEAVRFIQDSAEEPFFLYLAHSMPHVPLHVSERFSNHSAAGLYGDVIEEIDWSVGEVLEVLAKLGLDKDTFVIFTSDNGPWLHMPERMYGRDIVKPWHAGSTGPLRGWKGSTYEGGVRVPFIARWPGRIPQGRTSAVMASTLDLYPTLLGSAGVELPSDRVLDGKDIMNLLEGRPGEDSQMRSYYYYRGRSIQGIRQGKWKLRLSNHLRDVPRWPLRLDQDLSPLPDDAAPTPELYDLQRDPYEMYNLAEQYPGVVERLKQEMGRFHEQLLEESQSASASN